MAVRPSWLDEDRPSVILPGQLWQSGHPLPGSLPHADVVIGVAKEYPINAWDHPNATVIHMLLADDGPPEPKERVIAQEAARIVMEHLDAGRRVNVSCLAGLNRSGWVVGLVLKGRGMSGKDAIALMRKQRSLQVLSNEFFERIILRG